MAKSRANSFKMAASCSQWKLWLWRRRLRTNIEEVKKVKKGEGLKPYTSFIQSPFENPSVLGTLPCVKSCLFNEVCWFSYLHPSALTRFYLTHRTNLAVPMRATPNLNIPATSMATCLWFGADIPTQNQYNLLENHNRGFWVDCDYMVSSPSEGNHWLQLLQLHSQVAVV